MKPTILILLTVSTGLLASCKRSGSLTTENGLPLRREVLATVGRHPIQLRDFEAEMERRLRGRSGAFARPEEREALLQELIEFETVYQRAEAEGFDQKPEIARQIRRLIVDRFTEQRLGDKTELPPVTEAEIATYFEQNTNRFATSEKVRFAVVQLGFSPKATAERKAEVLQKADSIREEARSLDASEPGFGALAQRYSEDQATRYKGGDAGWVARGQPDRWDSAVTAAAFALVNPGDLSPVIATANGCYLVKLMGRRGPACRPLAEVKEALRYELAYAKRLRARHEFYESMKAGLKIEVNRPLLESLGAPAIQTGAKPPSIPAG